MKIKSLKNKIKEATINEFLWFLLCLFMTYALIDICWKIYTHSQYDMKKLIQDIQVHYPDSELTFQNIKIVYSSYKTENRVRGASYKYRETTHLFIRNGYLNEEPNFRFILIVLPFVVMYSIFTLDKPNIKLKEFHKSIHETGQFMIAICLLITLMMSIQYFIKNPYVPAPLSKYLVFSSIYDEVNDKYIEQKINIDDYRKLK